MSDSPVKSNFTIFVQRLTPHFTATTIMAPEMQNPKNVLMYDTSDLEISCPPAPSAIAIPANGNTIRGFKILWNAELIMDKQLATIMNRSTTPPIRNKSEHPTQLQNFDSQSPDSSKSGSFKQESMMLSISPDTDKVYVPVAAIFPVIPSANVMMYPMIDHMLAAI